ncbi:kinesin-like protein KIF18B [Pleurodeles waltl]
MAAPEDLNPSEGNVSVVVRVRPPNHREQEGNQQAVVQVVDRSMLVFDPEESDQASVFAGLRNHEGPKRKCKDLKFMFDHVFGETSSQQEVFQHTTKDILDGVLNGYNCSVFAYGATGAGKTHTMLGTEMDPGVMFLTMVELYRRIEEIKEEKLCEVLISYLEVYNEQIQDLLQPKGFLAIREDPQKGVVVQGLSLHQPESAEQLLQMLANGNKNRTQHPTDANATSSRSHAVFQIYVKQQDRAAGINRDLRVAKMSLIDLAGSERASSTNAKGDRQREGANINRSLLALINVINALADAKSKKPHIPYRDSKLTRLLKDSIGGNCRTVMIAAISPSHLSYDDTYNTLKYANRAKEIKLSLKSNVISFDCHISKYAAVCEELKAEVAELRQRLYTYERVGAAIHEEHAAVVPETCLQERVLCSLEESNQDVQVPQEAACEVLQVAGARVREFSTQTSARKCDQKPAGLSEDAKKAEQEPPPSPKYRSRLRPRNAALRREALQKSHSEHKPQNEDRIERLMCALLRLVRRQKSALEAANLQTPEMKAEFEVLEQLVQREKGALLRDEDTGQHPGKMSQTLQQTSKENGQSGGATMLETLSPSRGQLPMERAKFPNQVALKNTAEVRPLLKRCRREILPDCSPTLESPIVPVKKRRKCDGSPSSKVGTIVSTPEGQLKRPRKSLIPGPGRGSLSKALTALPFDSSSSSSTTLILPESPSKKTPLCTPKHTSGSTPKHCPATVTKCRLPLTTSAIQNCATVQKAPLPMRDLNTTFDLPEEGWPSSLMDKTVILGPSAFPGWENIGCNLGKADGSTVHRHEVAVFTMKGPSVSRSSAPQPLSTVKKSGAQRRRRSISISTSKSIGGPYNQSRIARLHSSTVKKVNTIVERPSRSPRLQTDRKTRKGPVPFGRALSIIPAIKSLQFAKSS